MLHKVRKLCFNYKKFNNFLSFQIKQEKCLIIKGFFGEVTLLIPSNFIIINNDSKGLLFIYCFFYTNSEHIYKKLKYIHNSIIYFSYGVIFFHMVNISIKGIGYRFILEKNKIKVYSGNSLPSILNIRDQLKILDNCNSNNFSIFCCDYTYLNFFIKKLYNISIPNRYKEIGVFIEKKL